RTIGPMKMTRHLIMILLLTLATPPWSKSFAASAYKNSDFDFSVDIPDGFPTCTAKDTSDQGPDQGLDLFSDKNDVRKCEDVTLRRAISFFAAYNVTDDTKTLASYRNWECAEVLKGSCLSAPSDLTIKGQKSVAVQVHQRDGWIDLAVL